MSKQKPPGWAAREESRREAMSSSASTSSSGVFRELRGDMVPWPHRRTTAFHLCFTQKSWPPSKPNNIINFPTEAAKPAGLGPPAPRQQQTEGQQCCGDSGAEACFQLCPVASQRPSTCPHSSPSSPYPHTSPGPSLYYIVARLIIDQVELQMTLTPRPDTLTTLLSIPSPSFWFQLEQSTHPLLKGAASRGPSYTE